MKRGEVYYIQYNDSIGSEQAIGRPGIVITADDALEDSDTVIVMYTSKQYHKFNRNVQLVTPKSKCWAMCNRLAEVDKSRLFKLMCTLSDLEMSQIDEELGRYIGLKNEPVQVSDAGVRADRDFYKRAYEMVLAQLIELRVKEDIENAKKMAQSKTLAQLEEVGEKPPVIEKPAKPKVNTKPKVDGRSNKIGRNDPVPEGFIRARNNSLIQLPERKVNINKATPAEMVDALHIDKYTASSISGFRKKNGKFDYVDELLLVGRMTQTMYARIKDYVEV